MRKQVRVEPRETLEVRIYDGRQRIGGRVVDISSEGVCNYTFFANLSGLKFKRDKEMFVGFKPPYTDTMMCSKDIITRLTSREGTQLHRLRLKIYPNPEIKPVMDDYIKHPQKELLNELEQSYLTLNRKKSRRG
jgi:hypothetical protein